jgi:hypothetical protein
LRYLETLTVIAADKNSTIVFPLPMDLISQLIGQGNPAIRPQAPPAAKDSDRPEGSEGRT